MSQRLRLALLGTGLLIILGGVICFNLLALIAQAREGRASAPTLLRKLIACLVAADFVRKYDLEPLGLKENDWAWARYHVGAVRDMSPTPDEVYVVIYSADGQRGILLLALPNNQGGYEAIRNAYQLAKHRNSWTADEGNGGYVDYEKLGQFVTRLSRQPRYRVQLVPGGSECTLDDAAYHD